MVQYSDKSEQYLDREAKRNLSVSLSSVKKEGHNLEGVVQRVDAGSGK